MENSQGEITRRGLLKTAVFGGAGSLFGSASLTAQAPEKPAAKARGVIFMVSDGMSPGVLTLAESYSQLTRQHGTRWWQLFNDPNSARGLMDTASASSMVTDSAAAASAWGGGKRINNGVINIDPAGRELTPIAALLKRKPQARIGLVTTATVRIPISLAISAITGAAPVPVPPPIPAVMKAMCAPRSASAIWSRASSAAHFPASGLAPAPRPVAPS